MKIICAWCGRIINEDKSDERTSHSVCPQCREAIKAELMEAVRAGVRVDKDGTIWFLS